MPKYRNSLNVSKDDEDPKISRRSFLALLGTGACLLGVMQMFGASILGFLYPNAMKTPPSVFSIGRPEEILATEGKLFNSKHKVFVESQGGRVRVQTSICTHLGCTVNMVDTGYSCPCHGSTYDLEGQNIAGPAPTPLDFYLVFMGASGDLLVDKARIIPPESSWYRPVI